MLRRIKIYLLFRKLGITWDVRHRILGRCVTFLNVAVSNVKGKEVNTKF